MIGDEVGLLVLDVPFHSVEKYPYGDKDVRWTSVSLLLALHPVLCIYMTRAYYQLVSSSNKQLEEFKLLVNLCGIIK